MELHVRAWILTVCLSASTQATLKAGKEDEETDHAAG